MTFTPGPWKTVEPGHGNPTEYLCVQIGEDEQYTTLELRPDDARLIAAAPDMYAACHALVAGFGVDADADDPDIAQGIAALRKAGYQFDSAQEEAAQ